MNDTITTGVTTGTIPRHLRPWRIFCHVRIDGTRRWLVFQDDVNKIEGEFLTREWAELCAEQFARLDRCVPDAGYTLYTGLSAFGGSRDFTLSRVLRIGSTSISWMDSDELPWYTQVLLKFLFPLQVKNERSAGQKLIAVLKKGWRKFMKGERT